MLIILVEKYLFKVYDKYKAVTSMVIFSVFIIYLKLVFSQSV